MNTLHVFDPPMCCPTGICGSEVDPTLVRIATDLRWLESQGVRVVRHNLAQEPAAFVSEAGVQAALQSEGEGCLPLFVVAGEIRHRGGYPDRTTLAAWFGIEAPAAAEPFLLREIPPACCPAPEGGGGSLREPGARS